MITEAQVEQAALTVKWCDELAANEAYQKVVIAHVRERAREHERAGTDVTAPAHVRAEHHHALRLAREIIGYDDIPDLLARIKSEAEGTLKAWRDQNNPA